MVGMARGGAELRGYRSPSGLALSPLIQRKTEELTKIVYTKDLTLPSPSVGVASLAHGY